MMSGIRSSNTRPEKLTRSYLHRLGYRFRLGSKVKRIKPDIVLRKYNVAIFTHGCFWHQHAGCKMAYADRDHAPKWRKKFEDNRCRDQRVLEELTTAGWRVAIIWECATRNSEVFEQTMEQLDHWIREGEGQYFESDYRKA